MSEKEFAEVLLDNGIDHLLVSKIEKMCGSEENRQYILQFLSTVRRLTGLFVMENMKEMLINVIDDVGLQVIDEYKENWKDRHPKVTNTN